MSEAALQQVRLAGLDVGQPRQQFAEDRVQLRPGNPGTQAEVHAAAAEPDVRVRMPAQVE